MHRTNGSRKTPWHVTVLFIPVMLAPVMRAQAAPVPLNPDLTIRLLLNTASADGVHSVRIGKDPRDLALYYLKFNGDIYRVERLPGQGTSTSSRAFTSADHGITDSAQGMAIGPDGTIYIVGNTPTNNGNSTFARIVKGVPNASDTRTWSLLARTEPYPRSRTAFDHVFNGLIVSSDGSYLYVNSGSRTDHGEVQSVGGVFPDTREVPLTAKVFHLPTSASGLLLPNDLTALRNGGFIFAEGVRNAFDFAFAPGGELFATDNGPDRDMSDELNWLRPGLHYGFPWRIGGADNPQQFPDYNPANDRLLDSRFIGVFRGYYHNDPGFPPVPSALMEPVANLGPDADKFRDPLDGSIRDASDLGGSLSTFTAHRSPLGLVFDVPGAMAAPFRHQGFVLGFTPGDANGTSVAGPFFDPGQDLLHLDLVKAGDTNYNARVTRIVGGFSTPIDAEIIANRVYVLEYSGNGSIWEITFPAAPANLLLSASAWPRDGTFLFAVNGAIPGQDYQFQASTNLVDWVVLTNMSATSSQFQFVDPAAPGYWHRFYRICRR
jgi:hypothetical protein